MDPSLAPIGRKISRITEVPVGRRLWMPLRLTRAGTGFAFMVLLLGVVAANPGLNLLLLLFGLGAALVLFNAIVCMKHIRAIEVRRMLPDVAAAGRPATIRYVIHNSSGWLTVRGLWLTETAGGGAAGTLPPVGYIESIGPGEDVVAELPYVPGRRGVHGFTTICLASRFPFGLVTRQARVRQRDELLAWPALWGVRFNWLSRTSHSTQARLSREGAWQRGTDEFFEIREYRPGDNTRWIHWRRSASFDRVMVRQMARSTPGHITLAMETITGDGPADGRAIDDLVSAAGSLACDALERGWHVGLIANGRPPVVLPPAGGRTMRGRILYELSTLVAGRRERRLAELLDSWPGGPAWAGWAVLLHADRRRGDDAIEAAAARLARGIGSIVVLGPDDLDRWFDRSVPVSYAAGGSSGARVGGGTTPVTVGRVEGLP